MDEFKKDFEQIEIELKPERKRVSIYLAVKDIEKNDELCIYYGDHFWELEYPKQKAQL